MTGYTSHKRHNNSDISFYNNTGKIDLYKNVNDTPLINIMTFSKDSTYLIGLLSYSCKACGLMSLRLNELNSKNSVDKVAAIFKHKSADIKKKFISNNEPNFEIIEVSQSDITNYTLYYPKAIFVKNNIITKIVGDNILKPEIFK